MEEIEATWPKAIMIWWSLAWRFVVYAFVGGVVIGGVSGMVAGAWGIEIQDAEIQVYLQIAGMIISVPIGIWVVKKVIGLNYKNFRIALVKSHEKLLEEKLRREKG